MSFCETVKNVTDKIAELGYVIAPGSRLGLMRRSLIAPDGTFRNFIPADDPSFEMAVEAVRDVQELQFILQYLGLSELSLDIRRRIQLMLRDQVLPQASEKDTPGRDTQCELYVATICNKAGLRPWFDEKPDLRCTIENRCLGIAVKRIKSANKFEMRIREAGDQIKNSRLPGVIVMDVSFALNPENKR